MMTGKETLTEASLNYARNDDTKSYDFNTSTLTNAFEEGAKWQVERSYSEEDLKNAFRVGFNVGYNDEQSPSYLTFEEWFKKFKK